jgi:exopolysaccharide biosynthesis polyprenyl glycosylphosphotransferase
MTTQATPLPADARLAPVWAGAGSSTRHWALVAGWLVIQDGVAVAIAFGAAYSSLAFWVVPVWLGLFGLYRLYDRRSLFTGFHEYIRVVNACTAGMLAVLVISVLDATLVISRGWILSTWLGCVVLVCCGRFVARRLLREVRRRGYLLVPTVIVGANQEGRALAQQLAADPGCGTRVLGFVDPHLPPDTHVASGLYVLGDLGDLEDLVRRGQVSDLVVAPTALARTELLGLYLRFGNDKTVELRLSSGLFEMLTTGVAVHEISCVPLVTLQRVRITGVDAVVKTLLDYVVAASAILLLSPLLAALAVVIRLDSPGPVLHRRHVLGVSGKPFTALKFRTMDVHSEAVRAPSPAAREAFERGCKLRDDPRVTRVGRLLRRTSLDELPQLFNVLRGDMSLVGPRMIAPDEAGRYGKWQLNLLTVKPGITGPWQVRGRADIPYQERVRLSMDYIRNYTIWLDLEILFRTIPVVVLGTGAY